MASLSKVTVIGSLRPARLTTGRLGWSQEMVDGRFRGSNCYITVHHLHHFRLHHDVGAVPCRFNKVLHHVNI